MSRRTGGLSSSLGSILGRVQAILEHSRRIGQVRRSAAHAPIPQPFGEVIGVTNSLNFPARQLANQFPQLFSETIGEPAKILSRAKDPNLPAVEGCSAQGVGVQVGVPCPGAGGAGASLVAPRLATHATDLLRSGGGPARVCRRLLRPSPLSAANGDLVNDLAQRGGHHDVRRLYRLALVAVVRPTDVSDQRCLLDAQE